MRTIMLLLLALLPLSADAAGWKKSCSAANIISTGGGLGVGEWACNDPDGDTPALNVSRCENFDVFYWTDANVDATVSTNTVQVRHCPGSTTSATGCWAIENVTLTGTTPAEAIYGAAAIWIYGDFDAAINNDPRITVHCNGPH